jgi:hypothetical protein
MTQPITGPIGTPKQARTGPMPTAGRYGWYRDHEGNEYRRVSTLIKKVETDNFSLEQWKLRQVAEGLAIRDDLVLAIKAMGRPHPVDGWTQDDKKKINGIASDAMTAAKQADGARRGTAYHDLTERLDRGEPLESVARGLPAGTANMLRAYEFLRRENGWRNIEIERTVVCDELECAGTFDRVDLVPGLSALLGPGDCQYGHGPGAGHDGHAELPVVVDVKSEKDPTLNGLHIGPQLGIYSRSKRMWRPTGGQVPLLDAEGKPKTYPNSGDVIMIPAGEYVDAPCVRQDVAIVVHTTETAATPLFINLIEGWEAARAAYAQISREARAKRKLDSPGAWFATVPGIKVPPIVPRMTAPERAAMAAASVAAAGGVPYCLVHPDTHVPCRKCVSEGLAPAPVAQQSYRRPDGMIDWAPAGEVPVGGQVEAGGMTFTKHANLGDEQPTAAAATQSGNLDVIDRSAIENVWAASELANLAETFRIYTQVVGRTWAGAVAAAGDARRRMIECPQRPLHANGGRCACGWESGYLP